MDSAYPRLAGVLVPVFALRHAHDFGVGDTQAMKETISFCAEQQIGLLQVLPINEMGDDNSPYNAISSIALDPIYLTLTPGEVPGLTPEILQEFAPPERLKELRKGSVKYREVKQLKMEILAQAYVEFEATHLELGTSLGQEFFQYAQANMHWLAGYTLFRTMLNEYQGDALWPAWAPPHRDPQDAENDLANAAEAPELERYRQFTAFVQWLAWRQWTEVRTWADALGVRLIGDIPFGISRYSADVWTERSLFDLTWSGGAPPEPFFAGDKFLTQWGQNWGIPLYNWDAHKAQNFAWWHQRIRAAGSIFHAFRIDHVLGFYRIYGFPWLPQENQKFIDLSIEAAAKLTEGRLPQFLPHPDMPEESAKENRAHGEELLKMVKEAAGQVAIVAEDLGHVPNYVAPSLQGLGIPGFVIPHFLRQKDSREYVKKEDYPELSVATWGTHDHATLKDWYEEITKNWKGPNGHEPWLELQRIMRYLGRDENAPPEKLTPELLENMLRTLLESKSRWVILTICDVLDQDLRFNKPGTATDDNWSQRLDKPLADYLKDPVTKARLETFTKLITATHRAPAVNSAS